MEVKLETAKKVITKDSNGVENGFIIELAKDGKLTTSYLSCCLPGTFKGLHLHKIRTANYVCVRGTIKIILYTAKGKEEHTLSADKPTRLTIPANIPTGLLNESDEEAWIVNNPDPPYDPDLKGEQIDFTQEQLDTLFAVGGIINQLQAINKVWGKPDQILPLILENLPVHPFMDEFEP